MALDRVHLNKLLRLFILKEGPRSTIIKRDARETLRKQDGEGSSTGGHFQFPFWKAAKDHAASKCDLRNEIEDLIDKNWRRKRLYPMLQNGFLSWWNERRRWINEPISAMPKAIKSSFGFDEIEGIVKVENLLSLKLGENRYRYIYPYFSEKPSLTPNAARLGLWLMGQALPELDIQDIRILDIIRGETYSIDKYPLDGTEEESFRLRYRSILREWRSHLR